ncbi:MAG: polysaccharide deacetylase family protein [Candidatus Pelethousia sp.]|nr:polysaccharide deacetylase family protein [Candidatus Pelethousia sp.]
MKKLYYAFVLVAICLSLLMYPETHFSLLDGLNNTLVLLQLSNFSYGDLPAEPIDKTRTQVVFMYDDGWGSVYSGAYPLLKRYGYRGSIAVIPAMVREREYMSFTQLAELYMEGWDILNHSYSHKEDMYFRCDEMLLEFMRAREWLDNHFFTRGMNMVITPLGECNPYLIPLLMKKGFQNIRTSDNVLLLNRNNTAYFPVKTIHLLTDVSAETAQAELMSYSGGGAAVLLNLHKIDEASDGSQMSFSLQKLETIIEFLHANEDKFQVVSYSCLFD